MFQRKPNHHERFSNRQAVVFVIAVASGLIGGALAGSITGGMMLGAIAGAIGIMVPGIRPSQTSAPIDPPDPGAPSDAA
ncbi:MAG: hypothetical protein QM753_08080 [Thermomicrobiales bacterium]